MAKLTTNPINSGYASNTAINTNNDLIEAAIEKTLSRDGTAPNYMEADLDMNNYKVINLAEPVNGNDGARLVDIQAAASGMPSQTGHATKFLGTDGTVATWQVPEAIEVSNTPAGNLAATTVQAALNELDTEKLALTTAAASGGAALIGFIQTGTGAVLRTLQNKSRDILSVRDFGALGDGTDDTAAMQAAHNTGKVIYYPAGNYKFSTLTIPGGGIVGEGSTDTILTTIDTGSSTTINYTGVNGAVFEKFQFANSGVKTAGFAITIFGSGVGEVSGSRIDEVMFNSMPSGISFARASLWSVIACAFYTYTGEALSVANLNSPDSGDSVVSDCVFVGSGASAIGILQNSSGGLKINANKFNNGAIGYLLSAASGSATSDLLVTGNSFENLTSNAIQLQIDSGTPSFHNVVITGNQFLVSTASGTAIYCIDSVLALYSVVISGNVITTTGTSCVGILLNYVTHFSISGNTILGNGAATTTGISIGANSGAGEIGHNYISGFTTLISNSSPTVVRGSVQSSTGTPTPQGGAYTTATYSYSWIKMGREVILNGSATITNAGTATGNCQIPLPFAITGSGSISGKMNTAAAALGIHLSTTTMYINKYDGTTPNVTGEVLYFGGSYITT